MTDNRWTTFKLTADFDTDVRSIYEAWTTPAGLESWFVRQANFYTIAGRLREKDEFIKKEDSYSWYWHGYTDDTTENGQILENNGTDLLKFTFTGGSIVTVDIQNKYGLTIVELTQENIAIEDDPTKNLYVQCQIGWTFFLTNLKSVIEGGKDLRNKRVDLFSSFK
ncbi:SRPBCC family protein [Mucilaginibacter sp. SP1R1]|uniref:SRPBCC family protein n=1 Tax=Mucilaginibacter sp. SP1R1 TaxID=2723091 RepID=UPI00161D4316|nr:SRPBCC domain-containing protein [Mucilaginibacter sp. SP1R1]MBB6152786.1 uncharacterized protein YndB with AHSA1/START domain [Mucilaginibacter sp. SP1R1]